MSFLISRSLSWLAAPCVMVAIALYQAWSMSRQRTPPQSERYPPNWHYIPPNDSGDDDSDDDDGNDELLVVKSLPKTWLSPYTGDDLPSSKMAVISDEAIQNFTLQKLAEMVDDLILQSEKFQIRALEALNSCKEKFSGAANFHWRLARSLRNCSYIKLLANNRNEQKELLEAAFQHAQESVRIDAGCSLGQRWLAMIFSEKTIHYPDGCKNALAICKCMLEKAVRNNPADHFIARELFFIKLQENKLECRQSYRLTDLGIISPQWYARIPSKRSHFYMALYSLHFNHWDMPIETYLTKGLNMPVVTPEDEILQGEITKISENLGGKHA